MEEQYEIQKHLFFIYTQFVVIMFIFNIGFNATRELKSSISTIGTWYLAFIVLISSVIWSKISSC